MLHYLTFLVSLEIATTKEDVKGRKPNMSIY